MITVTILTKNAARTLRATLESVKDFNEVLLLDNGSSDETLDIAKSYPNTIIHYSPFIGFGPLHNLASSLAKNDWIFSLDSDEVMSDALVAHLRSISLDTDLIYEVERKNLFNEKWIRGCGWSPDKKVRLFNRKRTQFTLDLVHEKVMEKGLSIKPLKGAIFHYSYLTISDFLIKMEHYSTLYSDSHKEKKSSLTKAIFMGLFTFFKSYIIKQGFLDGKEGFIISLYNSQTSYYKYLKIRYRDVNRSS
jgi:glycosyltransferase involved in cell wall biosynthesis